MIRATRVLTWSTQTALQKFLIGVKNDIWVACQREISIANGQENGNLCGSH